MASFPKLALVLPPAAPLLLHAVGSASGWKQGAGHSAEPWLVVLWLLYGLAALTGLIVVPYAAYRFATVDDFRTLPNLLCTFLGACVPVFVAGIVLRNVFFGT